MKINNNYDKLLKSIVSANNNIEIVKKINYCSNYIEFKQYIKENVKKSVFLAQILPLVLFLLISLISFSVVILSQYSLKFTVINNNINLRISILCFGFVFLIFAIGLFIQRWILKTKVIYIYKGYNKGYYNITNEKYNVIMEEIDKNINIDEIE